MRSVSNLVAIAIAVAAWPAAADPPAAEAAFARGRELLKAGKLADACAAFEVSLREDFAFGTLWNIAECNEKIDKLGSSWLAYHRIATEDTNAGRRDKAAALAELLAPRVGKLVVELGAVPARAAVALDGVDITDRVGQELAVDAGDHAITAHAPGYRDAIATVAARDGEVIRARVALEPIVVEPDPSAGVAPPPPRPLARLASVHDTGHPTLGKAAMISGAGLFVLGVGVAVYEKHVYDGVVANHTIVAGVPDAAATANRAGEVANWMTLVCSVGVGVAATGVVLWALSTSTVTVNVQPGGVALAGRF